MGMMSDPLTNDLFPQARLTVTLQGPGDLEGFRRAARSLLAQQIPPTQVSWHCSDVPPQHPPAEPPQNHAAAGDAPAVQVPPEFVALCESAILHRDPRRFELLYRLLWRLVHEPGLRHDPLDADRAEARRMAQEVRDEMHSMKAFVHFHSVQDESFRNHPEGGPLHVAWFESGHHIVQAVAPFLARRFAQMRWALLTPDISAQWDGAQLHFGPGASQEDAPSPDAGEKRWLRCYEHIFRPARRKRRAMPKDMQHRYQRKHRQVAQPATRMARRVPQPRAALAVPAQPQGAPAQLSLDALDTSPDALQTLLI
ncbi:MAG: TIGR03915 family putative DNA repair protein [Polaromonas sp.]|uniref:TIGR03915 family putative DNA repair protein n=1 Tax=Polaromonas sp. TaxID=1869339 RepID=UPI00271AD3F3|nr:TIGR03915 family putative DNA repair protein [Polaromonas sp.]MDO9115641.1 TIGR03915 family putative DNA repair protein [Polaromonas sp.]